MIKNEREYRIARARVESFEESLTEIKRSSDGANRITSLQHDALKGQISELKTEIDEYESLWNSKKPIPELESFDQIPTALVKARLSQGLSQKELADRLGLAEQQIQRYESSDYETASLARVKELVNALGLKISQQMESEARPPTVSGFVKKLRSAGFEREFVLKQLLPPSITQVRGDHSPAGQEELRAFEQVGRIFQFTPNQIFGKEPLKLDPSILGAKFKLRHLVNSSRLAVHGLYAQYLAMVVFQCVGHLRPKPLPFKPYIIHQEIIDRYGSFSLESCLRFVWNLGVPVLPIADSSAFQGAYFRENNRNGIVVKDRTQSDARWMFDLFHEFWHASKHQNDVGSRILQFENIQFVVSTGSEPDSEELDASSFASAVLLGRNPDDLVQECVKVGEGRIPRFKQAVIDVAQRRSVSAPALALCLAFRLAQEGHSWWGTAENLQDPRSDIQRVARDILLEFVDLSRVQGPDLDLLRRGLGYTEVGS